MNFPFHLMARYFDGAAVEHFLSTTRITTFNDYADSVFIPHTYHEKLNRVDVVCDTYIARSIKVSVREKTGKGIRRRVKGQNKIPSN